MYIFAILRIMVFRAWRKVVSYFTPVNSAVTGHTSLPIDQEVLDVIHLLKNGDFEGVHRKFVVPLRWFLSAQTLQGWRVIRRDAGPIVDIGHPVISANWFTTTIKVPIQFKYTSLALILQTTSKGGIFGLRFVPKTSAGFVIDWSQPIYVDPAAFTEVKLQVGSTFKTHGTLTLPRDDGTRCACVILLSGSGPCDQDSTVGSIKPFKDIAQGLSCAGIATIRFDKVTLTHPRRCNSSTMTLTDEYMDQAVSAVMQAQACERIASESIYILGHSLGAVIAPRVAQCFPGLVRGVILMAPPARPLYRCAIGQMRYLDEVRARDGADAKDREESEKDISQMEAAAALADQPCLPRSTKAALLPFGVGAAYWLDYRIYMPMKTAKELGKPLLILQGARDYQVTVENDYGSWRSALEGHSHALLKVYNEMNHLFVRGEGLSSPQEYEASGNVDPQVLEDITRWVESTSKFDFSQPFTRN